MKTLSTFIIATTLGLAVVGCKKDSTDTPAPAATKTAMLTAKSWRVTDVKISGISVFNSPLVDACYKDDVYKFNANKSLTFDQSTLKCDPTAPATRNGTWDLTTNETKLKITDPDGDSEEGTIATLTSTSLVVTSPDYAGTGIAAELTYTAL
jgi:hypothetical protein